MDLKKFKTFHGKLALIVFNLLVILFTCWQLAKVFGYGAELTREKYDHGQLVITETSTLTDYKTQVSIYGSEDILSKEKFTQQQMALLGRSSARKDRPTDGISQNKELVESVGKPHFKPRVALVISNLGLNSTTTDLAFQLPRNVTHSYSPYSHDLNRWNKLAESQSRDLLINLPLENQFRPEDIIGPYGLKAEYNNIVNKGNLNWILGRLPKPTGVFITGTNTFFTAGSFHNDFIEILSDRNAIIVYDDPSFPISLDRYATVANNLTMIYLNRYIDDSLTQETILASLVELEKIASKHYIAVGAARPYPISLNMIDYWYKNVKNPEIELVTISKLVK